MLQEKFPDYARQDRFEHADLAAYILDQKHDVQRHPCYVHGYQIADDIEHLFSARLLMVPAEEVRSVAEAYLLFELNGYSLASERYDQSSAHIRCQTGAGQSYSMRSQYDYQKYGGRHRDQQAAPEELQEICSYAQSQMQLADLEPARLADFVEALRRKFSF